MIEPTVLLVLNETGVFENFRFLLKRLGCRIVTCEPDSIVIQIAALRFRPTVAVIDGTFFEGNKIAGVINSLKMSDSVDFIINIAYYPDNVQFRCLENDDMCKTFLAPHDPMEIAKFINEICRSVPTNTEEYYSQMIERICGILNDFHISKSQKGHDYLRDALFYILKNRLLRVNLSCGIYPYIAQKHEVSTMSVERSMRMSIASGWAETDEGTKIRYFRANIFKNGVRPSNGEFLSIISEILRNEFGDVIELIRQEKAELSRKNKNK